MSTERSAPESRAATAFQIVLILGGLLLSLLINFHWFLPDFQLVPGDRGDSRLVIFTLEHWFRVLQGLEPFFRLQMFYPDPNALAYADGLFLLGLPYAAFRLAGLDSFSSYQAVQILLTAVGYAAWLQLLSRVLKLPRGLAVLGGVLLSSLNALQLQADIGKLTAVNLFPVLILWLWAYVTAKDPSDRKAVLRLAGFAAGVGLLFFTSYHPAWLLLFATTVMGLLALVTAAVSEGASETLAGVRSYLRRHSWQLSLAAVAFVLGLIPFVITYAPLVAEGSTRGFDLVLQFSPRPQDIVNVSTRNVVWSPMLRTLGFEFGNREVQMGSPLLVLLIAGLTTLALIRRLRREGWRGISNRDRVLLLLAATAGVLVLLSLKFGDYSAWYIIHRVVPGASALRAIGRVLIMMDLAVIILALCGLQDLAAAWKSRRRQERAGISMLLAALSVVLIAEQVNWTPFKLDKAEQLALVERYRVPNEECAAFYVNNASPDGSPAGYHQLDAMMISMNLGIPTVNGYSGFEPHEAFTLTPNGPEYEYRVLDWLLNRGATQGICELTLDDGRFRAVAVAREYSEAQSNFRAMLLEDFSRLHTAASRFLRDGNSLTNLYPQFLEEHNYLDASFGYEIGTRYRWMENRYWIGERACGNRRCFGIAVAGTYADLQPIRERYGSLARGVFFPGSAILGAEAEPDQDARGELLLLFPAEGAGN